MPRRTRFATCAGAAPDLRPLALAGLPLRCFAWAGQVAFDCTIGLRLRTADGRGASGSRGNEGSSTPTQLSRRCSSGATLNTNNAIISGLGIVLFPAAGVIAQVLTVRTAPWVATSASSTALAAGVIIIIIVVGAATGSTTSYLAGTVPGAPASAPPSLAASARSSPRSRPSTALASCRRTTSSPTERSRCPPSSPASRSPTSRSSRRRDLRQHRRRDRSSRRVRGVAHPTSSRRGRDGADGDDPSCGRLTGRVEAPAEPTPRRVWSVLEPSGRKQWHLVAIGSL
jgi:hypothetical protein